MKIFVRNLLVTFSAAIIFTACQKEVSEENNGGGIPGGGTAEATLGGDPGACSGTAVAGVYGEGLTLTDSNYVTVQMNFTKTGTFYVSTDTINGMYFSALGFTTTPGVTTVKLVGAGYPVAEGAFPYTVSFKESVCSFEIQVFPVAKAVTADYFPTSVTSNWTYQYDYPLASEEDSVNVLSTGTSASVGGNTYNLFLASNTAIAYSDSAYYRKAGGVYYEYANVDQADTTDDGAFADFIFLKDYEAAGTSWESGETTGVIDSDDTVSLRVQCTILEKNVSVINENTIYQNVIKVKRVEQVLQDAIIGWTNVGTAEEYWYAKGIGLIKAITPSPNYGIKLTKFNVVQ